MKQGFMKYGVPGRIQIFDLDFRSPFCEDRLKPLLVPTYDRASIYRLDPRVSIVGLLFMAGPETPQYIWESTGPAPAGNALLKRES